MDSVAEKGIVGKCYIGTCGGEDARHRVSTGHIETLQDR